MNLDQQLQELQRLTPGELRARYAELHGAATHSRNRSWLIRRIAWRLQALAEGDLTQRARRRAAELANDADLRVIPPKDHVVAGLRVPSQGNRDRRLPIPGTVLERLYKGNLLRVRVLDAGFEYGGDTYKTLTAVARVITDSHVNGFAFFRLGGARS